MERKQELIIISHPIWKQNICSVDMERPDFLRFYCGYIALAVDLEEDLYEVRWFLCKGHEFESEACEKIDVFKRKNAKKIPWFYPDEVYCKIIDKTCHGDMFKIGFSERLKIKVAGKM